MTSGITAVTSADELRSILGEPSDRVKTKERDHLTEVDQKWIAASPFCLIATSDAEGNGDVSPKGDPVGSLAITPDARTVVIPERPGNRRADGFHNILANPHVGLLFLIPGRGDTLRVNGRATVVRDAPYFDDLIVKGHRPILATHIEVHEVFFHCAKAFMRSGLWKPETWNPTVMPPHAQMVKTVQDIPQTLDELTDYYANRYEETLYEIR